MRRVAIVSLMTLSSGCPAYFECGPPNFFATDGPEPPPPIRIKGGSYDGVPSRLPDGGYTWRKMMIIDRDAGVVLVQTTDESGRQIEDRFTIARSSLD